MNHTTKVKCAYCGKEEFVFNSRAVNYKYCSKECMKKAYRKNETPMVGERINNWEIIEDDIIRKNGRNYIKVKCTCGSGIESLLPYHHYKDKKSLGCKRCSKSFTNKGYKEISGTMWSLIKSGAEKRGLEFNISIEYAWDLYIKQNKCCALSGIEIFFAPSSCKDDRKYQTASLDRIDSNKGYIEGNIQWVHKDYNIMKNKFSKEYFNDFIIHAASMANLKVKIKRLHPNSVIPKYAKQGDAGLDLTAVSYEFDEYGNIVYHTGLSFEIPEGFVGLIFPRSSICKKDLSLTNAVGVIDSGFRGEVTAKFKPTACFCDFEYNTKENGIGSVRDNYDFVCLSGENRKDAPTPLLYEIGDRIAQMIIIPYPKIEFKEVEELSETERGDGSYGSTGR